MPDDALRFLMLWYRARCNRLWEHGKGISIESLSTPGWAVVIDLAETPLDGAAMSAVNLARSDRDWMLCKVEHNQFSGEGDPDKLGAILEVFQNWAARTGKLE
jgi:hypothetical protein